MPRLVRDLFAALPWVALILYFHFIPESPGPAYPWDPVRVGEMMACGFWLLMAAALLAGDWPRR